MSSVQWPRKLELFGVRVSQTDYDHAEQAIMAAARQREGAVVTHLPVHGIVTGARDRDYRGKINSFEIAAPDGQPVRWALNWFCGAGLKDRVYGPELMLRLCRRAAASGVRIYLYGSTPGVLAALQRRLRAACPGLEIAGCESPPFCVPSEEEDEKTVQRINGSGAGLVFIGLGLPKQDHFAYAHRDRIRGVLVCVGAAFDFHAGTKKTAPPWMQRSGLEWLFRLAQEPGRLWRRYASTNTLFVLLLGRRLLLGR